MDFLIDWNALAQAINQHYHPKADVIGRPASSGTLFDTVVDKSIKSRAVPTTLIFCTTLTAGTTK